ncbi:38741_t:CDS:2 [Gigaspora margarita]|uniref:38741_t:CDS:1 n=1 Tax=Gigaspora margarita TaxID=4874 RepID=A0ABN7W4W5_GIGMA|nr:38741_t:CDS:2 [Gigaspora margarita]
MDDIVEISIMDDVKTFKFNILKLRKEYLKALEKNKLLGKVESLILSTAKGVSVYTKQLEAINGRIQKIFYINFAFTIIASFCILVIAIISIVINLGSSESEMLMDRILSLGVLGFGIAVVDVYFIEDKDANEEILFKVMDNDSILSHKSLEGEIEIKNL